MPSGHHTTARDTATTVRTSRRTSVERIIVARVGCSPLAMMRSSQYSVARWLSRPRPTPTAIAVARRHSPSWPAIQNAATARTSGHDDGLALVAQHGQDRGPVGARVAGVTGRRGPVGRLSVIGAAYSHRRADAGPEAERAGDHADGDADHGEDRAGAGRVVDDDAEAGERR